MKFQIKYPVWFSFLAGIAAAEIIFAGVIVEEDIDITTASRDKFGIATLCRSLLGLSQPNFYSELRSAIVRMHQNMDVATTRNPDQDFAQMMLAHHQGAIDMALVQLKYGREQPLRRLAQTIIVEQEQEIVYMRSLLPSRLSTGTTVTAIAGN